MSNSPLCANADEGLSPACSSNCLVCGAANAKQHYGSWCCNGCKGFFWRTVSSKRSYICLNKSNGKECEIQDGRRNSCRACRLKRCLLVGMDPNLIRDSWGKTTALRQQNCANHPNEGQPRPPSSSFASNSEIGDFIQLHKQEVKMKVEPAQMSPTREENLPLPFCANNNNSGNANVTATHIQLLSDYLDWVQGIGELKLFSEQDKNLLILSRTRPSIWLLIAKHLCWMDGQRQQKSAASILGHIHFSKLEALYTEIVGQLLEMNVTRTEFEFVRLICFFSTAPQMSADGKKMATGIQSACIKSLTEMALNSGGKKSPSAFLPLLTDSIADEQHILFRTTRILHIVALIEKFAHQYD